MSEVDKQNVRRRESDIVLVELTSKIVENNNSVSAGLGLMSENIEEMAEAQVRIENKIDDYTESKHISGLITDIADIKKYVLDNSLMIKKLDEAGLFTIIKNIKRFLWFIMITISSGIIWVIVKDIFMFYIKRKLEGVVP